MEAILHAEPRTEKGKGPARRLRASGRVPATLYGAGVDANAVSGARDAPRRGPDDAPLDELVEDTGAAAGGLEARTYRGRGLGSAQAYLQYLEQDA